MPGKKDDMPAFTLEVVEKGSKKALAMLWVKKRETPGSASNWTILNGLLGPHGKKVDGKGCSLKLTDVLPVFKISQKNLKRLGIDQDLPSRPATLKEAVRTMINMGILDEDDADLISSETKESQVVVDRKKADEVYLKEIENSLQIQPEEKTIAAKNTAETMRENDTHGSRKNSHSSSFKQLLVQCIRSKVPELAQEIIKKAKMIEGTRPVTTQYCWMCRKVGHPSKNCLRIPLKIRNMCMACGRTDHDEIEGCLLTEEICAKCGTTGHHRSIHVEADWPKKMMLIEFWGLDGFEDHLMANKKKVLLSATFDDSEDERSPPKRSKILPK